MKIRDGFMLKKVGGQYVAVALGEASRDFNGIVHMNEVGKRLWELLSSEKTEEQLITALTDEYEIDEARAKTDIKEFTEKLRKAALLV